MCLSFSRKKVHGLCQISKGLWSHKALNYQSWWVTQDALGGKQKKAHHKLADSQFSFKVLLGFLLHFSSKTLGFTLLSVLALSLGFLHSQQNVGSAPHPVLFPTSPKGKCYSPLHHPLEIVGFTLIGPTKVTCPWPPGSWGGGWRAYVGFIVPKTRRAIKSSGMAA